MGEYADLEFDRWLKQDYELDYFIRSYRANPKAQRVKFRCKICRQRILPRKTSNEQKQNLDGSAHLCPTVRPNLECSRG